TSPMRREPVVGHPLKRPVWQWPSDDVQRSDRLVSAASRIARTGRMLSTSALPELHSHLDTFLSLHRSPIALPLRPAPVGRGSPDAQAETPGVPIAEGNSGCPGACDTHAPPR